jgi:DNA-directed RNA polymerase subunit RPC12/RpoP
MSNVNCLRELRCPNCGSLEPFDIEVYGYARVWDDGIERTWNHEWDSDYGISCPACGTNGTVKEFENTGDKS